MKGWHAAVAAVVFTSVSLYTPVTTWSIVTVASRPAIVAAANVDVSLGPAGQSQAPDPPVIDGRIGEQEWFGAARYSLTGGGDTWVLSRGDYLYVAVRGPGAGIANLCVTRGSTVRILHASAAVGEARYERDGAGWARRSDFEWTLRETAAGPSDAERAEFLSSKGWLSTASSSGSTEREFQLRKADVEALGVTHLATADPLTVSSWPAAMNDDCRSVRVAQGYLPERLTLQLETWHRVTP